MNDLENIKQQLLWVVSHDYTSSRNLAMKFLKKNQPVPEQLLYRIAEHGASAAKEFALWHAAEHMPIPELLIKKITEDKGHNIDFARNLVDQFKLPVPDITLETIINARDLFDIWTIYEEMLKNDVIPPDWFAQNALDQNYIYPGAGLISQPPEPTNELAYYMAQAYLMYHPDARSDKNLPDYFLKPILANQGTSFSFLKWLNRKGFPVPKKLQNSMKNNKLFRKQMQKKSEESEENQNKPDLKKQMLQIVASNPRESLRMAVKLLGQNKPIPEILMQGLDRDPEATFELLKAYMNKFNQAPKSLENSIVDQLLDNHPYTPDVVLVGKYVLLMLNQQQEPDIRAVDLLIQYYKKYAAGKARFVGWANTVPSEGYFWKMITAYAQFFKTIPDHILKKFAQDAETLYMIGDNLYRMNMKIPVLIINALKNFAKTPHDHRKFTFRTDLNLNNAENMARIFELSNNAIDAREPITTDEDNEDSKEKIKQDLKKQMLQIVASDERESLRMAVKLLGQNKPIPEILMQGLQYLNRDPQAAMLIMPTAIELLKQNKPIPEILLQVIAEDHEASMILIERLMENGRNIPKLFVPFIKKYAYKMLEQRFLSNHVTKFPEQFFDILLENDTEESNLLLHKIALIIWRRKLQPIPNKVFDRLPDLKVLQIKNVDELSGPQLQQYYDAIVKDIDVALSVIRVDFLSSGKPVPEIFLKSLIKRLEHIDNTSKVRVPLHQSSQKSVPSVIFKLIESYLEYWEWKKNPVPDILFNTLAQHSPYLAGIVAKKMKQQGQKVDWDITDEDNEDSKEKIKQELLQVIAKSMKYTTKLLLKYVQNKRSIPLEVMIKLNEHPEHKGTFHLLLIHPLVEKMRTNQSFDDILKFATDPNLSAFNIPITFMCRVYKSFIDKDEDDFFTASPEEYARIRQYMQNVLNANKFPFEKLLIETPSINDARFAALYIAELWLDKSRSRANMTNFRFYSKKILEHIPKFLLDVLAQDPQEFARFVVKYLEYAGDETYVPLMDLNNALSDEIIQILSRNSEFSGIFAVYLNQSKDSDITDYYPLPDAIDQLARKSRYWRD